MEYDGTTDTLRAYTRNGSRLELPEDMKDDLILANEVMEESKRPILSYIEKEIANPYVTWSALFATKLLGVIQARLYMGDFLLKDLQQDFRYTFCKDSWGYKHKRNNPQDQLDVFNSSSFASLSLLYILESQKNRAYRPKKIRHKKIQIKTISRI